MHIQINLQSTGDYHLRVDVDTYKILGFSTTQNRRHLPTRDIIYDDASTILIHNTNRWGCRGRDHMVTGFTTTYAISAYHH
jgi:hypothetical protein